MFTPGDLVPDFTAKGAANPDYHFGTAAGRYLVLCFIGSSRLGGMDSFLAQLQAETGLFDDDFASIYLISNDSDDEREARLKERYPGIRVFWDSDRQLLEMFGCVQKMENGAGRLVLRSFILDPGMRVLHVVPLADPRVHLTALRDLLAGLPSPTEDHETIAPVLHIPAVLEPELCRRYIDYAMTKGTQESGFMRTDPATGKTVIAHDHSHKRRSDCMIEDSALKQALQVRVLRRLVPQIKRAFQFEATRIERYIISAYDAQVGGYFRPHRDNTTLGTAHRRFAVSINLNTDDYEGGDLRFPEFGQRTYRPSTGGAVVFSCSLLHEATPVTAGRRFCILPFLYDDAAAEIRTANAKYLDDEALRQNVIQSVKR